MFFSGNLTFDKQKNIFPSVQ